jgi:putative endopeptidase
MKRKLAVFLATLMTFSFSVNAFAGELTKGEYAEMLLEQAKEYNTNVKLSDIITDTSAEATSKKLTKAEALVMLRRAFGTLPTLKGDLARKAPEVQTYTDLPFWAVDDVTALSKAGVLSEGSGEIGANDIVSEDYTDLMASRMYRLFGTNLKDDYYATVNHDYLENSEIEDGSYQSSHYDTINGEVGEEIAEILSDIILQKHNSGSINQKIKDFYLSAVNERGRNRLGIKPIESYLESIRAAKSDAELLEVSNKIATDTTMDCLVGFSSTDLYDDKSTYLPLYQGGGATLSKDDYAENGKSLELYKSYLVKLLELGGNDSETAEEKARMVIEYERDMAENKTPNEEYSDIESAYNYYTFSSLQDKFKSIDLKSIADTHGFNLTGKKIVVTDPKEMECYAKYFDNNHTELLKTLAEVDVLSFYSDILDEDFMETSNTLNEAVLGFNPQKTIVSTAFSTTASVMDEYLGRIYCERTLTAEKRGYIEQMVKNIRDCYEERIQGLTWMSDSTKAEAIKKLNNIRIVIGAPEEETDFIKNVKIVGPSAGDDAYIRNIYSVLKASDAVTADVINGKMTLDSLSFSADEVNAMYCLEINTIILPAAVLNAPFYDENASDAENYGGIGAIIGHEMSHAFDSTGAKFDGNGDYKNWWTDEDYASFNKLSKKTEEYYDGAESATGIAISGKMTLDENIADIGGAEVALDALKKVSNGTTDYDTFFKSYANTSVMTMGRDAVEYMQENDVHAPSSVRINYSVKSMDEFYETYDVKEGDGMYVADEDRIRIW